MTNKSKAKGTAAETRIVRYLNAAGIISDRLALKGNQDQGDVWYIRQGLNNIATKSILEIKAGKQTQGYPRSLKKVWLEQTAVEGTNAQTTGHLVIAKHNASIADYEVWSSDGSQFWYLDDFVSAIGGTPQKFKGGKLIEEH